MGHNIDRSNSDWHCGRYQIGLCIDHRDRIGIGIGHISVGAIGCDRYPARMNSHQNRGFDGIGACVNNTNRVRLGISYICAGAIWGDGNINRMISYLYGRDYRIAEGADHRDALGPGVRDVGGEPVGRDRYAAGISAN